ncbi:hypothetical protein Aasi_0849 [Candidatus Amoebophilus asiaticus 5a2]|uniref:U-box domain-containing protein n=1 Tax=Amoebophilus asiaticus (strain 5a2) TaxID=452471 RepID=B3ESL8_AMOA5|nr:ankyrin repeat domain-containing protein [Candidatus Amoebophilus asiaticus]ACE06220.1 hypothetical protein Aasi_0849 [Candidatus Amoebophilus asiaticus 5a2]
MLQQYITYVLLISLCLQSCTGLDNLPLRGEERTIGPSHQLRNLLPIPSIEDQQLTAHGGHSVTFYEQAGALKADVVMNTPPGFSKNYKSLEVRVEPGMELPRLFNSDRRTQENCIYLQLAKRAEPAKVKIYNGSGLAGGMLEGEEEQTQEEYEANNESIPDECFCPITQEIMKDPVIVQDGHTYERTAIEQWFSTGKCTSPKTGLNLLSTKLTPNYTMRSLIQELKESIPNLARHKVNLEEARQKIYQLEQQLAEGKQKNFSATLSDVDIAELASQAKEGNLEALIKILDLSKNHHTHAQYQLGIMYKTGRGVEKDYKKAVEWLQKAAEKGDARAQRDLIAIHTDRGSTNKVDKQVVKPVQKNEGKISKLYLAVQKGHTEAVKRLLTQETNINVNERDKNGMSTVHLTSGMGNIEILKLLLEYKADVNTKNINGCSPLYLAIQEEYIAIINLLLKHKANVNLADKSNRSPLYVAIRKGSLEMVNILLDYKANINCKDIHGFSPLHLAAGMNHLEIVGLLIDRGANIEAKNKDGRSALYVAVDEGNLEMVRLLLEKGADINTQDEKYIPLLHWAVIKGNLQLVKILLDYKAGINLKDKNGLSPLHIAVRNGHLGIASILLAKGHVVDAKDKLRNSPLHVAALMGDLNTTRLLLKRGADVNSRDHRNFSPLHWAASKGHLNIVKLLIEEGANVYAKGEKDYTPLYVAHSNNQMEVSKYLIEIEKN